MKRGVKHIADGVGADRRGGQFGDHAGDLAPPAPGGPLAPSPLGQRARQWYGRGMRGLVRLAARLDRRSYPAFIARNDQLTRQDLTALRRQLGELPRRPLISLIVTLQAPQPAQLRQMLDAVRAQIYPHWELLLTGDSSLDTLALVGAHGARRGQRGPHGQIRVLAAAPRRAPATLLNLALEQARGQFVGRLGQHDLLAPHALLFMARELAAQRQAELLYADDDLLDQDGRRCDPRFKPDWNPDLFYSTNYLGGLTLLRRARALQVGGWRKQYAGAEDYDLLLRFTDRLPGEKVRHVARVLCHARPAPAAKARAAAAEHQAGKRALAAHFEGGASVVEDGPGLGLYRVRHAPPPVAPLVSILIPTRDGLEILKKCISSIRQNTSYPNWELLVIDNGSEQPATLAYLARLRDDARIRVLRDERPFNYSALNNLAAGHARGELLALLNNDVEVISADWLAEMVGQAMRPGVGAVGAKLLYSNGRVQHAGVFLGIGWVAGHGHKMLAADAPGYHHRAVLVQNVSAVTAACLVVRKSSYLQVGGLNESRLAVAFNDIDFCLKLGAAGYRNVYTPHARLYHHESVSRGEDDTPEKQARLRREYEYMKQAWGALLCADPAYNPNLTRKRGDFSLSTKRVKGYLR